MQEKSLTIFEDKGVRRTFCDGQWYFAVADVVASLTGSRNPDDSWPCLKARELATCGVDLSEVCRWLEMDSVPSGHRHKVEAATLEGIFRIVQAISSPRAEVFKRWLARVGEESCARQGDKAELSRLSAQTKLMPLRYKAELSRLSAQTKLIPLRYKTSLNSILAMLTESATAEIACRQSVDQRRDGNAACKARRIAEEARKSLADGAGK
jgi:prophage antirepressor-like protein